MVPWRFSSRVRIEFHWHVTSSFCQKGGPFIQLYHLTGKLTFGNGYGGDIKLRSPFHICLGCLFFYYYMRLPCSITYNQVYVMGFGLPFQHRCIVSKGSPTHVPLRPTPPPQYLYRISVGPFWPDTWPAPLLPWRSTRWRVPGGAVSAAATRRKASFTPASPSQGPDNSK